MAAAEHPFYPRNLALPHGYVPNDIPVLHMVVGFFGALAAAQLGALLLARTTRHGSRFSGVDRAVYLWAIGCGCIHLFFEGYYALFHTGIAARNGVLDQLWKEYGAADSRYMFDDPFIVGLEVFTAFVEGPLAFVTAFGMLYKAPSRYVAQMLFSFGELYGVILYFVIEELGGGVHSRPEPIYYWFFYIFLNSVYVVVPTLMILHAAVHLMRGTAAVDSTKTSANTKPKHS